MNALMISMDRAIFDPTSDSAKRMCAYGEFVDSLDVIVFAKKDAGFKETLLSPRVRVCPTNSLHRFAYMTDAVRVGKKLVAQKKFGLVIAQNPFETGKPAVRLARACGARLLLEVHTDFLNPYFKKEGFLNRMRVHMARKNIPKADGLRVVSNKIRFDIRKMFPRLKAKISVLPIFTPKNSSPSENNIKKVYPEADPVILIVARLEEEKNVRLALEVFKKALKDMPKAKLVIVGTGSMEESLKKKAHRLGLDDRAVFAGYQTDMGMYYRGADILLVTSNYEGYGRMFVEAAREGLAIVSTDAGIARDILSGQNKRALCPVGDRDCLTDAIMLLGKSKEIRHEVGMGGMGMLSMVAEESWEAYLQKYKEIWDTCAKKL